MKTTSETISVSAIVNADVKKVWDYYTNPAHIIKWNSPDPSWYCPSASNDLQVGGKYAARMEAKDGSFGFDFEGIYSEVTEDKKLSFTMPDGRQVSAIFEARGNQTEVIVTFDPEDQNSLEMQRNGWQAILNNFKNYTESN